MAERILMAYATTDGHTLHICERLKLFMTTHGQRVTLVPIERCVFRML